MRFVDGEGEGDQFSNCSILCNFVRNMKAGMNIRKRFGLKNKKIENTEEEIIIQTIFLLFGETDLSEMR